MAEEKKEEGKEGAEGEAKPKSKKMLIIIIVVVVVLLAAGGAAFALMGGKKEGAEGEHAAEEEEEVVEEEPESATVELEPIIVNLSENAAFLKVKLMLEYNIKVVEGGHSHGAGGKEEKGGGGHGGGDKGGGAMPGVLGHKVHLVKDSIIRVLSSKKAGEVLSLEGKDKIKEELIQSLNEACGQEEDCITNVYFLDFIVQ